MKTYTQGKEDASPAPPPEFVTKEVAMACAKLEEYLNERHVRYVSLKHSPAFTAQEVAASAHIPGREVAKTVVVKLDGQMAMVVLPAPKMIRMNHLKAETGAGQVELATEEEFKGRFPDCEVGAMPPFGNLYDMDTFVEESLTEDEEIAFNAGTHTELIRMAYADYQDLVHPRVLTG
jgi:Ala-tRNA(Pro) deacylase